MAHRRLIMHCSLFAGMLGILTGGDAYSAVRIGNATRNSYYGAQMAEQQRVAAQQQVASTGDIDRMAGNTDGKSVEPSGTPANDAKLAACSAIYPNGEFSISRPTMGVGVGGAKTCVATVELRGYQMGANGSDVVLARANVAAGSTINCNISDFPESTYTPDVSNVIFPADAEPTKQDVVKVLNKEQKQNAALKIAATTLVGAIGGNIAGKNDIGNDSLMGTDKGKVKGTVIGALGGAAIGAGSVYGGKVAGDMILSTSVNAAAGGVVGNIMAAGDSVLRIEKCKVKDVETSCLWGYLVEGDGLLSGDDGALCKDETCYKYYVDVNEGKNYQRCDIDNKNCVPYGQLISVYVKDADNNSVAIKDIDRKDMDKLRNQSRNLFHLESGEMLSNSYGGEKAYMLVTGAKVAKGRKEPVLIADFEDSTFGKKEKDWTAWKDKHENYQKIYTRDANGNAKDEPLTSIKLSDIYPMYIDAEDGPIVDLGNKARLKTTLIGAGAGGALGAFTAYEGAQDDIDERWVSAMREYKDSLQKFYCATGSRFLSYYNDPVFIPKAIE